ncbi:AmmeMemoRadiSam system protein B [Candidatus Uhrbacteria bacterium]|nr:AmmeMemoRadiSam system protein B [Candidatus Uhrbacteria bacterium]
MDRQRLTTAAWIIGGTLVVPLLLLLPWLPRLWGSSVHPTLVSVSEEGLPSKPFAFSPRTFQVDNIEGIGMVLRAAKEVSVPASSESASVSAAVLPHHTLLGKQLAEQWSSIAASTRPSVIVLIGPAHQNQGRALVQTTRGVWKTSVGSVSTADAAVLALVSSGVVSEEPDSFENEHSVGAHVPYLAKLFPGVPIIPIIAKSPAEEFSARKLVTALEDILPSDALVVSSIDFSHGLRAAQADAKDAETLSLVSQRDYAQIDGLSSEYLDSPFALDAYLLWMDMQGAQDRLVWQEHSGRILQDPTLPGTSYLVFFARLLSEEPLTLTAVGDLMLARSVATWLAQTTVEDAFGPARDTLAGSDFVFGNLESVLSTSSIDIPKEIRFKADPARVDALTYAGFTHLSVANNHIGDYGEAAWQESSEHLRAAGIEPVGGYRNDGPIVIAEANGRSVAFLAFESLIRPVVPEEVSRQVQAAATQADLVIASFHWGVEYQHLPHASQITLAHAAIDAGADLVIGHHPHVLQGIETYKDGLILYSLGNFVFDQFGEDENETVVAKIRWEGLARRQNEATADGKKRTVELIPMRIERGFPRPTIGTERAYTLNSLASWSASDLADALKSGMVAW